MAMDYDREIDNILDDLDTLHETKVDAVNGKQLSTNDFTDEHLRKVNRIETEEYQQEIVSGVTKELERTNDNHVRLADEFHRHLYGQDGVDAKFRKEIQDNLNYMSGLVKSANDRMNEIWQNWDEIVKEDQNHELRLQQVEGKTLAHDALIDSNTSEILNIQGEQVIQNNQIKEMQDKSVELETRVVDVEVSDADQNHRLDIAENRIGTFTDKITALEDGYAQRDARMDGLDAQVSRYTERMLALELNEKAQNDRIKAEEEKNKRQDIDIACLYAEAKDRTITLDTEGTSVELQNSREGFVTINSIEGNTMVNCNKDVDKELTLLTSTVDVSSDNNVTLTEGVVDGGKVDVYLEGNTLVNVSKTKDATPITHESEDTTGNHVPLADEGSMRPVLNGNTLVNVCDQKDSVAITKSYTVETGNHVALQGEYDGKCRPVITGNTLVNVVKKYEFGFTNASRVDEHYVKLQHGSNENSCNITMPYGDCLYKPSTTYTLVVDIKENTSSARLGVSNVGSVISSFSSLNIGKEPGRYFITFNTKSDFSTEYNGEYAPVNDIYFCSWDRGGDGTKHIMFRFFILEGDYTNKPIPEYFEGLKSSFEDKVVTQEMVDAGEELAENLGKYKVDYVISRQNGTVGQTKTFYLNSPLLEGDTIEQQGDNVVHVHRYGKVVLDGSENWYFNPTNYAYTSPKNWKKYPKVIVDSLNNSEYMAGEIGFGIRYSNKFSSNESEFKQYLQRNPVTVVYELATPQYEVISQNDTILCDSYTNGHLDVDSVVPIERVDFRASYLNKLKYTYPSTDYIIQFESDNVGTSEILVGGSWLTSQPITKGLNKFTITTKSNNSNTVGFNGIGFNASNIVVTPAIEQDFNYFSGMQSCFEDNLVTEGENAGKYRVEYKVTGKNKFDGVWELGGFYWNDGSENDNEQDRYRTGLIRVNPNINYAISYPGGYNPTHYFFYDKDKNFIGFESEGAFNGKKSMHKAYYVRFLKMSVDWDNEDKRFMLEEGTKATSYEPYREYTKTLYLNSPLLEGDTIEEKDGNIYHVHRYNSRVYETGDENTYITDLITTVFPLETPQYELIQQGTIAIPSYSSGHLDVTSAVPVDKVNFLHFEEELTYLYPSTPYTVQFNSDNATTVDITLGGKKLLAQSVVKGLNKITITIPETLTDNKLIIDGVGANIKEVVVTNSNREFGYFEGMKSVGECEDLEVMSRNKNLLSYPYENSNKNAYGIIFTDNGDGSITINGTSTGYANYYFRPTNGWSLPPGDYVFSLGNDSVVAIVGGSTSDIGYNTGAGLVTFRVNDSYVNFGNLLMQINPGKTFENVTIYPQIEEGSTATDYIPHSHNTQTLTHEPLRGIGEIKDKYVLIDGKWYIERNCGEVVLDGSEDENWKLYAENEFKKQFTIPKPSDIYLDEAVCNNFKLVYTNSDSTFTIYIGGSNLNFMLPPSFTLEVFKQWLQSNPVTVVYQLATPTYEPIDYNPFEVYNEVTHISANSTIPCNVTVKNHGYNCILKPSTTYTVVSNQGVQNMTTPATLGDSLRFSGNGVLKDVMILEGTLSDNQIPGFFAGMESCYEQKKITDEHDEHFGYYEVLMRVNAESGKESVIKFYIKDPLRGIGDVKDKVFIQNDKVIVERNCGSVTFDGSEDEEWIHSADGIKTTRSQIKLPVAAVNGKYLCDRYEVVDMAGYDRELLFVDSDNVYLRTPSDTYSISNVKKYLQQNPTTVVYLLVEPIYEEAVYSGIRLSQNIWEKSTLFFDTNIPSTANISYSISTPVLDQVAEVSSITDDQDALIIDMATQLAVLNMTI